jgi:type 1 glutamine amidotransferase
MRRQLLKTASQGYRHDSIPQAIDTIRDMGYNATFTEDPSYFNNSTSLSQYDALVFLSTSDEILEGEQKENLESYLLNGGGLVGIHSATSSLFNTPFYGTAFGAFFDRHPELQNATFQVVNDTHPSTSQLPSSWNFVEEVYNFRSDPRDANVTVRPPSPCRRCILACLCCYSDSTRFAICHCQLLMTVDRDSYEDPGKASSEALQGSPHPIAWYRDSAVDLGNDTSTNGMNSMNGTQSVQGSFVANGRMWYTSLGHTIEIWQDPTFQSHIKGGIDWVLEGSNQTASNATSGNNVTAVAPVNAAGSSTAGPTGSALPGSGLPRAAMLSLIACTLLLSVIL